MSKRMSYKSRLLIKWSSMIILAVLTFSETDARSNPKVDLSQRNQISSFSTSETPVVEYAVHNRGNMQIVLGNNGTFGSFGSPQVSALTGETVQSCIYPRQSDIVFLWVGALWIGAVVGRDTVVSCATEDWYQTAEFWPDPNPRDVLNAGFRYESIDVASDLYSPNAKSEEDITCYYTDTLTDPSIVQRDPTDQRNHKPLNLKVKQRTMAWSYSYADDFILFDYEIESIGFQELNDVYLGVFVDGDVWHITRNGPQGWNDDIVGFYRTHPAKDAREGCEFVDTINVAWTADNDGDPAGSNWDIKSATSLAGVRVVRTPSDSLSYSFNWWIINYSDPTLDFGPRQAGTADDPFRRMNERLGTPMGDRNKYYLMNHDEFDYDLMYTALDLSSSGWLPPPEHVKQFASGYDSRYLLSFGPFNISPGQKLPITFAWIGGEGFHQKATDFEEYFDPQDPDVYYSHLNFSQFASNSIWASWVFDNPGVDTDNDGYAGKFRICEGETTFYEGDGVPDFRGASPPPPPKIWVTPSVGSLHVRFNGFLTETTKDRFSNLVDFEGYRVYLARDDRPSSYSVVASLDLEDFNKYIVSSDSGSTRTFLLDPPYTLDSLRCLYAQSCDDQSFDPLLFTRTSPLYFGDSVFYFEAQDFNVSKPGIETPIRKSFPDQPYPSSLNIAQVDPSELTDDNYLKYFEYEIVIDNLLPTVAYWVSVTAFDYGSPASGLSSLESSVSLNPQQAYAGNSAAAVDSASLDAYVYPNPYRQDGDYSGHDFENIGGNLADERARRIHFANLPAKCTISIYSIDGDLVREIFHDVDSSDPTASHDEWDMITRNTQAVVSGLYYFVIESAGRTQIGKLSIIR